MARTTSSTGYRISIAVNILLLAVVVNGLRRRPAPPAQAAAGSVPSAPIAAAAPAPTVATAVESVPVPPGRTNFHWSQVESTDYLVYVRNLRAIGCPEETLRDIIVADINKLYAPRYAALAGSYPELAWWGRFNRNRPVRPELAAQIKALNADKKALVERLLGPGPGPAWSSRSPPSGRCANKTHSPFCRT